MPRYYKNLAILVKPETVYGTDAAPAGANLILGSNVSFDPFLGEDRERDIMRPFMGHAGLILTGNYARLTLSVELAGSGVAGTPPKWGPLMRMCGMAQAITAGDNVAYKPVSGAFEAGTIYLTPDGVRHVMLGARGTWSVTLTPSNIPMLTFVLTGLLGVLSDAAAPAYDGTGWPDPVPVSKANTTLTLHGYSGPCEGFSFDLGATIEPRMLIGSESIEFTNRKMTGSATLEAVALATKNWQAIAAAHTLGTCAAQHGTVAGNIVKFDEPAVQIGRPGFGQTQNIINTTLPLIVKPSAGNDEIVVTVK